MLPRASCTCVSSTTVKLSVIEPWRSSAFPVIKDLAVDRSAFDKILQAGGFVSINTGGVPDAMRFLFRRKMPTRVWMRPAASVAERA